MPTPTPRTDAFISQQVPHLRSDAALCAGFADFARELEAALSSAESRARLAEEDAERWTFCLANISRFNRIVRDVENSLSDSLQLPWPDFRDEGKRRLVAAIDAARGKER